MWELSSLFISQTCKVINDIESIIGLMQQRKVKGQTLPATTKQNYYCLFKVANKTCCTYYVVPI